jgi:hypothetical protein
MGVGMGFTSNATVIAVQNAVDWNQRGVATASTQFFRTIGGSISVAIMGALLNSRLAGRLEGITGVPDENAEALLDRSQRALLSPDIIEAMERALAASLHEMFFVIVVSGALCLAAISFFPRGNVTELAARPGGQPGATSRADEP